MEILRKDIVIAGAGAAGLAAAISAAEKGAKVLVLEKRERVGGISVTGMGLFAVESRLQKLKNHPLTREEAFHFFMDCTHWRADGKLVAKYINRSASTIDWLEDMGVKFQLLDITWGQHAFNQTGHIVCTPEGLKLRGGVTNYMIQSMLERAVSLGVEVMVNTEIEDIIKENGRVASVIAKSSEGTEFEIQTKAAVITTGGYASDPEMLMEHDARTLNRDFFMMHNIRLDGKGIKLAWKAGAGCDGMCLQQGGFVSGIDRHAYPDTKKIPFSNWLTGAAECPVLYVNLNGRRFIDESLFSKTYKGNAIARQKNKICYAVFDSNTVDYMENVGVQDVGYMDRESPRLKNIREIIEKNAAENTPCVVMADTLEALALKCGIDAENLAQTVDTYNEACDKGWDQEFGKGRPWLQPVRSPRFYALMIRLEGYGTVGGIRINENGEAVTDNDERIPGLYAAGDCANNAVSWDYSLVYTLWGSTLGLAVNTGRFAGESAGDYIKTI